MICLTNKQLAIKLIHILNKLDKGYYELKKDKENIYHVILYNNANYGVYSAIYNEKHEFIGDALIRLQETIGTINKM